MKRRLSYPLLRAVLLPWILILLLFGPLLQGRIPLNIDWLTARHYPWKAVASPSVHNPDIDDPAVEFYPLAARAARVLRTGRIPLWNPDIGCGAPHLADFISQPLDPLFLLSVLITASSPVTWALLLLLQQLVLALAVAGFLLARRVKILGAAVGATAVVFASPLINWMELRRLNASMICMFLAFWAIERHRFHPWKLIVFTGAALAYGGLAGHPQFTLYAWILAVAYLFYRILPERTMSPAVVVPVIILAGALCAPAILPQLELLQHAARGEPGRYYPMFRFGAAPWLSLLAPDILGHPASRDYFGGYIYFRSYTTLPVLYFGALPLTVILLTFRRRIPGLAFFGGTALGLMSLLTIMALPPVRHWLFSHVPGLFGIDPARAAILAPILLAAWSGEATAAAFQRSGDPFRQRWRDAFTPFATLAVVLVMLATGLYMFRNFWQGVATDNSLLLYLLTLQEEHGSLINAPSIRRALVAFALAGLVICLSRFYDIKRQYVAIAAALVMAADLLPWAIRFNPFSEPDMLKLPVRYEQLLAQHREPMFRSAGIDSDAGTQPESAVFPPNTLSLWRMPDFRIYTSTPLASQVQLVNAVQQRTYWDRTLKEPVRPLLDLASVKWFYTPPGFQADLENAAPAEHHAGLNVYINGTVLPRLRVTGAHRVEYAAGQSAPDTVIETIWDWLHLVPLRFRYQTLVEVLPDTKTRQGLKSPLDLPEYSEGRVVSFHPSDHRITAVIHGDTSALAVLSDAFYPGWTATVNDRPVPILRANGMFRAVAIPRGESRVVFRYAPVSFRLGLFLMLVAFGAVFLVLQQRVGQEE